MTLRFRWSSRSLLGISRPRRPAREAQACDLVVSAPVPRTVTGPPWAPGIPSSQPCGQRPPSCAPRRCPLHVESWSGGRSQAGLVRRPPKPAQWSGGSFSPVSTFPEPLPLRTARFLVSLRCRNKRTGASPQVSTEWVHLPLRCRARRDAGEGC